MHWAIFMNFRMNNFGRSPKQTTTKEMFQAVRSEDLELIFYLYTIKWQEFEIRMETYSKVRFTG